MSGYDSRTEKMCPHGRSHHYPCESCAEIAAAHATGYAAGMEAAARVTDTEARRLRERAAECSAPLDRAWLNERATVPEKLSAAIRAAANSSNSSNSSSKEQP